MRRSIGRHETTKLLVIVQTVITDEMHAAYLRYVVVQLTICLCNAGPDEASG